LPEGYRLAIIEGWRPPHIQLRMYLSVWRQFQQLHPDWSDVQLKRVVNRFSAPLDRRVPPPHTTGGAVDLMLADASGQLLDHTSPYDPFDPHGFPFAAPGLSETARRTRQMLAEVLNATGLTNYPSEYWHWSFGDQGWAYRGRHACALYGPIEPLGYVAPSEEVSDAPLESIDSA
jgi:D-alanyl-D-alanine dipeptidase